MMTMRHSMTGALTIKIANETQPIKASCARPLRPSMPGETTNWSQTPSVTPPAGSGPTPAGGGAITQRVEGGGVLVVIGGRSNAPIETVT